MRKEKLKLECLKGVRAGAMGVAILAVKDLFEVEHLNPTAFI